MITLSIFFNLSIIFPALVGLYVFKSISKEYRYFIVCIIAGTIKEYNSEFNILNYHIVDAIYSILGTQLTLLLYFHWDLEKTDKHKKFITHAIVLVLILVDQYYDYRSIYYIKWGYILTNVGIAFYGIRLLTQSQNNLIGSKANLSRKLIIIPLIVFSIYFATINILMQYLFNADTKGVFMDLYNVIRWINFLSYSSYILALLWAPMKEKFL